MERNWAEMDENSLDSNIIEFQLFLKDLIHKLPGPRHPAVKFYELRKRNKNVSSQNSNYNKSSNPERKTKRDRKKRKKAYIYQAIQFDFYNSRKKAVRKVFDNSRPCPIGINQFEEAFESSLGSTNSCTDSLSDVLRDNDGSVEISLDEVVEAVNKMNMTHRLELMEC